MTQLLPRLVVLALLDQMDRTIINYPTGQGPTDLIDFNYLNSQGRPVLDMVDRTYLLMCLGKSNLNNPKERYLYEKWVKKEVKKGSSNWAWGKCICEVCRNTVPEAAVKFIKTIFVSGGATLRTYDFKEFYIPVEKEDWEGYTEPQTTVKPFVLKPGYNPFIDELGWVPPKWDNTIPENLPGWLKEAIEIYKEDDLDVGTEGNL